MTSVCRHASWHDAWISRELATDKNGDPLKTFLHQRVPQSLFSILSNRQHILSNKDRKHCSKPHLDYSDNCRPGKDLPGPARWGGSLERFLAAGLSRISCVRSGWSTPRIVQLRGRWEPSVTGIHVVTDSSRIHRTSLCSRLLSDIGTAGLSWALAGGCSYIPRVSSPSPMWNITHRTRSRAVSHGWLILGRIAHPSLGGIHFAEI